MVDATVQLARGMTTRATGRKSIAYTRLPMEIALTPNLYKSKTI